MPLSGGTKDELTAARSVFQVPIQKRQDVGVAGLQSLQRNVEGPVFKGVQGRVGQRSMTQAQL